LFAAVTGCVISVSKVQSELKTLPKYLNWETTSNGRAVSTALVLAERCYKRRFWVWSWPEDGFLQS